MSKKYIVAAYCDDVETLQAVLAASGQCTVYTLTPAEYREAKLDLVVPEAKASTNGHAAGAAIDNPSRTRSTKRIKTSDAVLALLTKQGCTVSEVKRLLPDHKASTIDTTLWQLKKKGTLTRSDDGVYSAAVVR